MLVSAADDFLLFKQIMVAKNLELEMEARNMLMRAFATMGQTQPPVEKTAYPVPPVAGGGEADAHALQSQSQAQPQLSAEEEEAMLIEVKDKGAAWPAARAGRSMPASPWAAALLYPVLQEAIRLSLEEHEKRAGSDVHEDEVGPVARNLPACGRPSSLLSSCQTPSPGPCRCLGNVAARARPALWPCTARGEWLTAG